MTAGAKWIFAIVGLLVGNVLAMVLLFVAAHHGSSQVIPSYYERAVHYDDAIDQAAHNRALGWRVDAAIAHGEIVATALDRDGAPLDGAHVHITATARGRRLAPVDSDLVAGGAGRYRGAPTATRGWHDLTIVVERDGARYVREVAVEAMP
jgi:nitrogen fixation protein FixH